MKFQRYLYNVSFDGLSVAKYVNDNNSITLIAEDEGEAVSGYTKQYFDSNDDYINWIDNIIGDRDEVSADAQIVKDLLDEMKTKLSQYDYDASYRQKAKKKLVVFNTEKQIEADILSAIDNDTISFSERCKELLAAHYNIKN